MNGGPPFAGPSTAAALRPVKGLTVLRLAVLRYVEDDSGATRKSPMHFHASAYTAARWLAEHGSVGAIGRGFYPLKSRPATHEDS